MEVEDNGAGIPPEVRPYLFRPFSRHAPKNVQAAGTGLGLSIVKRHVDGLGGRIEVRSAVGRGSAFIVRLPIQGPPPVAGAP